MTVHDVVFLYDYYTSVVRVAIGEVLDICSIDHDRVWFFEECDGCSERSSMMTLYREDPCGASSNHINSLYQHGHEGPMKGIKILI